jgi:hypothetical protein
VSASLLNPVTTATKPVEPAPAARVVAAPEPVRAGPPPSIASDPEWASFGKAILLGIALGVPILGGLMAIALKALAPSMDNAAVFGVALWVGLFCGPFLAGTVTVGLSSRKWH